MAPSLQEIEREATFPPSEKGWRYVFWSSFRVLSLFLLFGEDFLDSRDFRREEIEKEEEEEENGGGRGARSESGVDTEEEEKGFS